MNGILRAAAVLAALALTAAACVAASAGEGSTLKRPYLFFDSDGVEDLAVRCSGSMRPQFDALVKYADDRLDDVPPALEGDYERRGLAVEHPYLTNILAFSFLRVVTGDDRYLAPAKRWTLALASMEMWAGPAGPRDKEADRGLYAGFGLTALAAAYDWLHADLADDERAIVRGKIAKVTEGIYRATYGGEWWSGAYLHHDHWIPVAGMGLGALALLDEADDAGAWAARAEAEFVQVFNRLGDEGAWHEGVCGWAFGMASFVPFWDAYARRFPTRLDERPWLRNTWAYRLRSRLPDGTFLTFGDGRATGAYQWTAWQAAPVLRFLAAKYDNPHAQWLAAREWEHRPNPYTAVWEIIWADPELDEASPTPLARSALFSNQGLAILRTGWDERAAVAIFRCDSVVGRQGAYYYDMGDERINVGVDHAHADANSFALWAAGGPVINPAGYGQRETQFQNSLLVDGKGQYRHFNRAEHPGRPSGEVTRFFPGRFASFVTGQAAGCYEPGLHSFERTLYLVQPGVAFVVDSVAAERPVSLEWLFCLDRDAAVTEVPGGFLGRLDGRVALVRFARPAALAVAKDTDRWNVRVHAAPPGKTASARLVTAVVAGAEGERLVADSPAEGVFLVEAGGTSLVAAFPARPGRFDAAGRLAGEGACGIATLQGPLHGFLAVDALSLSADGMPLLSAAVPVTVSCMADDNGGRITIVSPEPTQVAIDPRIAVANVTVGVGRAVPYLTDGPRIILNVPAGMQTYELIAGEAQAREGN